MLQVHERPIAGKVPIIAPTDGLTAADIQKADLLLAALYDAGLCAERVAMKLDCVATALRRQFIFLGLATSIREQLRQEGPPMTAAQSTYDALLWELHEYGVHRFKHQPTQWRLGELSAPQVQDLTAAIKRLRSKYPTHLYQSFDCSNWEDFKMTGPISKMQPNKHLFNATLTQPDPEFSQRLRQTVPGMAHFAGTGPVGETCGKCRYLIESTRRKRSDRCAKYTELMRCIGDDVPKQTPACRYYSARRP